MHRLAGMIAVSLLITPGWLCAQSFVRQVEYQTPGPAAETFSDSAAKTQAIPSPDSLHAGPPHVPLKPSGRSGALKLAPPGQSSSDPAAKRFGGAGALVTIGSSLAIVLGLFVIVVWIMRRAMPASAATLPSEVVQVLGRTTVGPRHQLHVLRFGNKLLLVSITPGVVETLGEITDPNEVTFLAGLCQQKRPGSATATFRQVLEQLGGERSRGR